MNSPEDCHVYLTLRKGNQSLCEIFKALVLIGQ